MKAKHKACWGLTTALMWAGTGTRLLDLLLPGLPQEVALGMAGGAVFTKGCGLVGGVFHDAQRLSPAVCGSWRIPVGDLSK